MLRTYGRSAHESNALYLLLRRGWQLLLRRSWQLELGDEFPRRWRKPSFRETDCTVPSGGCDSSNSFGGGGHTTVEGGGVDSAGGTGQHCELLFGGVQDCVGEGFTGG